MGIWKEFKHGNNSYLAAYFSQAWNEMKKKDRARTHDFFCKVLRSNLSKTFEKQFLEEMPKLKHKHKNRSQNSIVKGNLRENISSIK